MGGTRKAEKSNWFKHGMAGTPEYEAWKAMRIRCNNVGSQNYHKYGARGIRVCDRWNNSFEAFYEDMGSRPTPKHSLDRLDNLGDYTPENCHWGTAYQQTHNRRPTRAYRRKGNNKYIGVRQRGSSWAVFQRIENGGRLQLGGFRDALEAAYVRDQIVLQGRDPERSEFNVLFPPKDPTGFTTGGVE